MVYLLYGIIDVKGNTIVPISYETLTNFKNECAYTKKTITDNDKSVHSLSALFNNNYREEYYKIDKAGNETIISKDEYNTAILDKSSYQNKSLDDDLIIKTKIKIPFFELIKKTIVPIIIDIVAVLIILRLLKRKVK